MICTRCGAPVEENASFCENCGAPIERAEWDLEATTRAPVVNGGPLCPNCGAPIDANSKFCKNCGAALMAPTGTFVATTPAPQSQPSRKVPGVLIGVGAAAVALALGIALGRGFLSGGSGSGGETPAEESEPEGTNDGPQGGVAHITTVTVPNLRGKTASEAEAALEDEGLVGKAGDSVYDDEVPSGCVVSQSPSAGSGLNQGESVTYQLSLGSEAIKVPDLRGKTASEAEAALEAVGLVGRAGDSVYDANVAKGCVVTQVPSADTEVNKGESVTYQLSLGKEMVAVPDVIGCDQSTAESLLEGAGFIVDVSYGESSAYSAGTVMWQSPTGSAERGSTVSIEVSMGAPQPVERKDFPATWNGSYEGTNGDEFISRPVTFRFDKVGDNGALSGVCEITVIDEDSTTTSSYRVDGYVDWDTDEFFVSGTSWINNEGGFTGMRSFSGYVNYSSMTISGTTWNAGGETSSWSVTAS